MNNPKGLLVHGLVAMKYMDGPMGRIFSDSGGDASAFHLGARFSDIELFLPSHDQTNE